MKKLIFISVIPLLLLYCAGVMPFSEMDSKIINSGNRTQIHTTTGQELMDLKEALDTGTITQEEYDELRKKIMGRYDATADSTETN